MATEIGRGLLINEYNADANTTTGITDVGEQLALIASPTFAVVVGSATYTNGGAVKTLWRINPTTGVVVTHTLPTSVGDYNSFGQTIDADTILFVLSTVSGSSTTSPGVTYVCTITSAGVLTVSDVQSSVGLITSRPMYLPATREVVLQAFYGANNMRVTRWNIDTFTKTVVADVTGATYLEVILDDQEYWRRGKVDGVYAQDGTLVFALARGSGGSPESYGGYDSNGYMYRAIVGFGNNLVIVQDGAVAVGPFLDVTSNTQGPTGWSHWELASNSFDSLLVANGARIYDGLQQHEGASVIFYADGTKETLTYEFPKHPSMPPLEFVDYNTYFLAAMARGGTYNGLIFTCYQSILYDYNPITNAYAESHLTGWVAWQLGDPVVDVDLVVVASDSSVAFYNPWG